MLLLMIQVPDSNMVNNFIHLCIVLLLMIQVPVKVHSFIRPPNPALDVGF
jgi:hypothetical protein